MPPQSKTRIDLILKVLELCKESFFLGKTHMAKMLHCRYTTLDDVLDALTKKGLLQKLNLDKKYCRLRCYKTTNAGKMFLVQHSHVAKIVDGLLECRLNRCD